MFRVFFSVCVCFVFFVGVVFIGNISNLVDSFMDDVVCVNVKFCYINVF